MANTSVLKSQKTQGRYTTIIKPSSARCYLQLVMQNITLVDIGQYSSGNDSGVLNESHISTSMEANTLNVPEPELIEGTVG